MAASASFPKATLMPPRVARIGFTSSKTGSRAGWVYPLDPVHCTVHPAKRLTYIHNASFICYPSRLSPILRVHSFNALLKPRGRVLHRGGGWSGMAGRVASRCCCCRRPQLHLDRRAPNALHPLNLFLPGFGSSCQGWLSSNWPTWSREPCDSFWEMGLGFETIAVP